MAKSKSRARPKTRNSRRAPAPKPLNRTRLMVLGVLLTVVLVLIYLAWPAGYEQGPAFDGERALANVEQIVEIGPCAPLTPGHARCRDFLIAELEPYADQIGPQTFTYRDKQDSTLIYEGTNIVASFNMTPEINKRVLLAAHWDHRSTADQESDSTHHTQPVPGANDGASGVAVLLEVARLLAENPPDIGVDLVLFDLEDIGQDNFTEYPDSLNAFAVGSAQFVEDNPTYRPTFGILLDMVGDRNLRIPQEALSLRQAGHIVRKVWAIAEQAGADAFLDQEGQVVYDDHVAFLQKGIPVINLIHTPFPSYWHTLDDTPDKISAESLRQVGQVVMDVLWNEAP